ncbi:MAG: hypothetical protein ACP5KV_00300 [Candidatus Methanomethylicaceae archaeon]
MKRRRLQITLDDELYIWLTREIKEMRFGSYSHSINFALKRLRKEERRKQDLDHQSSLSP